MQKKSATIAVMAALGVTLALASGAASAHERLGFAIGVGVPAYAYSPVVPAYYEGVPYYAPPAYYVPPAVAYYVPRRYGYEHRYWREREEERERWERRRY